MSRSPNHRISEAAVAVVVTLSRVAVAVVFAAVLPLPVPVVTLRTSAAAPPQMVQMLPCSHPYSTTPPQMVQMLRRLVTVVPPRLLLPPLAAPGCRHHLARSSQGCRPHLVRSSTGCRQHLVWSQERS